MAIHAARAEARSSGSGPSRCDGSAGQAAVFSGRRVFVLKAGDLIRIKAARHTDPIVRAALVDLVRRADVAAARKARSVMDKTTAGPSGDRHDFVSLAPYWWPDPANPGGPYIRWDGEVNPERSGDLSDHDAIYGMAEDVETLGLAYFYTGDSRYATAAARMVRTWFLDPASRMNPNMNFAQAVRGREEGRAEGVLDTNRFIAVIDAIGLIGPSGALTKVEVRGLEAWFSTYVDWMRTSVNGKGSAARTNNHSLWYDAQLTSFALFSRRPDIARETAWAFPTKRIAVQFAPTGALPEELARTRSMHYSLYGLAAAFDVAALAECVGMDLWHRIDGDGRSLRKAAAFLAAYRDRPTTWPYPQKSWPAADLDAFLLRADSVWGAGTFPQAATGDAVLMYRPADKR